MSLNIKKKKKIIVTKINEIATSALSLIILDIQNISANTVTKLRRLAFDSQIKINVVKNTLLKLAILNTPFECFRKNIKGANLLAFSMKHPGSAARLLKNIEKEMPFKIKTGIFEKKILSNLEINALAAMPTYNESITHILLLLQEITVKKLIRILIAIKHDKQTLKKQ